MSNKPYTVHIDMGEDPDRLGLLYQDGGEWVAVDWPAPELSWEKFDERCASEYPYEWSTEPPMEDCCQEMSDQDWEKFFSYFHMGEPGSA